MIKRLINTLWILSLCIFGLQASCTAQENDESDEGDGLDAAQISVTEAFNQIQAFTGTLEVNFNFEREGTLFAAKGSGPIKYTIQDNLPTAQSTLRGEVWMPETDPPTPIPQEVTAQYDGRIGEVKGSFLFQPFSYTYENPVLITASAVMDKVFEQLRSEFALSRLKDDTVNDSSCYVMEGKRQPSPDEGPSSPARVRIWFDQDHGVPIRIEVYDPEETLLGKVQISLSEVEN